LQTISFAKIERIARRPKARLALKGKHQPGSAHQVRCIDLRNQRINSLVHLVEQALARRGVGLHMRRPGIGDETQAPAQGRDGESASNSIAGTFFNTSDISPSNCTA